MTPAHLPSSEVLSPIHKVAHDHDHVDVHLLPHTERVLVQRYDRVGPEEGPLPRWQARLDDDLPLRIAAWRSPDQDPHAVLDRCEMGTRS